MENTIWCFEDADMFARRVWGHAEKKGVAGVRRGYGRQPTHSSIPQRLLPRPFRPIRRVGWRDFRLGPVKLSPNAANEAEAICPDMFDTGLMAIGRMEPAFRAGQNGDARDGVTHDTETTRCECRCC